MNSLFRFKLLRRWKLHRRGHSSTTACDTPKGDKANSDTPNASVNDTPKEDKTKSDAPNTSLSDTLKGDETNIDAPKTSSSDMLKGDKAKIDALRMSTSEMLKRYQLWPETPPTVPCGESVCWEGCDYFGLSIYSPSEDERSQVDESLSIKGVVIPLEEFKTLEARLYAAQLNQTKIKVLEAELRQAKIKVLEAELEQAKEDDSLRTLSREFYYIEREAEMLRESQEKTGNTLATRVVSDGRLTSDTGIDRTETDYCSSGTELTSPCSSCGRPWV